MFGGRIVVKKVDCVKDEILLTGLTRLTDEQTARCGCESMATEGSGHGTHQSTSSRIKRRGLGAAAVAEADDGQSDTGQKTKARGKVAVFEIEAAARVARDVGEDHPFGSPGALLADSAVRVDPGREAGVGSDQHRFAALDRSEHRATSGADPVRSIPKTNRR